MTLSQRQFDDFGADSNATSDMQYKPWLQVKVLRREITQDLQRGGMTAREQRAESSADSFLKELQARRQLRSQIEQRSRESRRQQMETLEQNAEAYRQRLRSYMRPEELPGLKGD